MMISIIGKLYFSGPQGLWSVHRLYILIKETIKLLQMLTDIISVHVVLLKPTQLILSFLITCFYSGHLYLN